MNKLNPLRALGAVALICLSLFTIHSSFHLKQMNLKNSTSISQTNSTPLVQSAIPNISSTANIPMSKSGKAKSVIASWYGEKYRGKLTANGERFNPDLLTAASKTLKFGTLVKVTSKDTGLSTIVRINDRGPFVADRALDLSESAARTIGIHNLGVAPVTMEVLK